MRIKSPFLVRSAGQVFAYLLCWLFRTLRLQVETTEGANPYASEGAHRFLFSVWHDSSVIAAFGGRHRRTVALTSNHRDGSFVAAVTRVAGVPVVRGSTGMTGSRAVRELLRVAAEKDIVITPDGPRGPSRTMSRGLIFLASRTGNAIVPTAFACSSCWRIGGRWTTLMIPRPFSRVVLLAGDPVHVPPAIESPEIDAYVKAVQVAMEQLDARAVQLLKSSRFTSDLPRPVVSSSMASQTRGIS